MKLSDIPKPKREFNVPEQFFNTMQNSVLQRIAEQEKQKIIIRKRIFTISAIAASFILIMGIGFIFLNDFTSSETHDQLAYSVVNKAQKVEKKIISDTLPKSAEIKVADTESKLSSPQNATIPPKYSESLVEESDIELNEEDFNDIDYQILEIYSDEIVFIDNF
ncbi:MAG TPA: hypothetical protein PKK66_00010 [Bacteroidales bacterium]|nr:hypothetical protein [Bacteroidales bacterium]HPT52119.1 hypothetical protein [Bacteroidales bacterium]